MPPLGAINVLDIRASARAGIAARPRRRGDGCAEARRRRLREALPAPRATKRRVVFFAIRNVGSLRAPVVPSHGWVAALASCVALRTLDACAAVSTPPPPATAPAPAASVASVSPVNTGSGDASRPAAFLAPDAGSDADAD